MLTQLQFVLVFIFCIYIKLSFSPVADAGTSVLPPPAVQITSLHTNHMNNTALHCTQPEQSCIVLYRVCHLSETLSVQFLLSPEEESNL